MNMPKSLGEYDYLLVKKKDTLYKIQDYMSKSKINTNPCITNWRQGYLGLPDLTFDYYLNKLERHYKYLK